MTMIYECISLVILQGKFDKKIEDRKIFIDTSLELSIDSVLNFILFICHFIFHKKILIWTTEIFIQFLMIFIEYK
jgi:hypothetical protein